MSRRDLSITLFSGLILLAAAAVMGWLVTAGESMDSRYAEYSTLRSDPVGMRAFFEALTTREDLTVTRWHDRIAALPDGRNTTLFICGANTTGDPKTVLDALNRFVVTGGRVVVAFSDEVPAVRSSAPNPKDEKPDGPLPGDTPTSEEEDKARNKVKPGSKSAGGDDFGSIEDLWEFQFDSAANNDDTFDQDKDFEVKVERSVESGLPEKLAWHSPLFFVPSSGWWASIYRWRKDEPGARWRSVVMERALGQGSVVLCSETYLLSNEAMANARSPEFLSWLVGPSRTILFDETHLGISYRPGIAHLLQRYRLQGLLCVLIVLGFLFVWKNATSLLPRRKRERITDDSLHAGDSLDAFSSLLRAHTPRRALLPTCVEEWRKLHGQADGDSAAAERLERITAMAGHSRTDIAQTYNKIASLLSERSSPGERRD